MDRENKIDGILRFARGEKVEKHYLKFLDTDGNIIPDKPVQEINSPCDVVVQFEDFRKKEPDK